MRILRPILWVYLFLGVPAKWMLVFLLFFSLKPTKGGYEIQKKLRDPNMSPHRTICFEYGWPCLKAEIASLTNVRLAKTCTLWILELPILPQTWRLTRGPYKRNMSFQVPSQWCYVSGREGTLFGLFERDTKREKSKWGSKSLF